MLDYLMRYSLLHYIVITCRKEVLIMIKSIEIPKYSFSEELISSVSHGIGAGLAVSACVLGVVKAARDHAVVGTIGSVSAAVFGLTMIMLYCMSTIYHAS